MDDHSRFCIRTEPKNSATGVKESFIQAFQEYGLPDAILSDHGSQFAGFKGGYTHFERWLMDLDILPIHGRIMHPQTQGKIERFHRTMKAELLREPFLDLKDAKKHFARWRWKYNEIRPHSALNMKTPASVYTPSKRLLFEPKPYEYTGHVCKVNNWGYLRFGPVQLFLSETIYQLRNEDSTRDYRFEPYDRLQAAGRTVDKANYMEVYAAPLTAGTTLEDIYRTFNIDHPADFKGHSLSVSDVVVLHQNGQDTAHYCDSVGFQQVPEFLRENPLRTAELSTEQNENMIDGVLNNAPSLGELEAKAKAGEQISLTDLAAAVNAAEKAPKAKKAHTAKPKKPSIRAQLDAAKKEQSKQTPPREKAKELEV